MSILIAYTKDGKTIHINDFNGEEVFCTLGHELIGKRGEKKIAHYCHKKDDANEHCSKGKTDWHLWWQNRVKKENIEVKFKKEESYHIADIYNPNTKCIIEIQYSPINKEKIQSREKTYKNMIWIFSAFSIDIEEKSRYKNDNGIFMVFRVVKGSLNFLDTKKRTFLDFDRQYLLEIIDKKKKTIIGKIYTLDEFDKEFFNGILNEKYDRREKAPKFVIQ